MKRCLSIFCLLVFLLVSCQPTSSDITDTENETSGVTDTVESTEITDDTTPSTEDTTPQQSLLPLKGPIIDKEPYTVWRYGYWGWLSSSSSSSESDGYDSVEDYDVEMHSVYSEVISYQNIDPHKYKDYMTYKIDGKPLLCKYGHLVVADNEEFRSSPYIKYVWLQKDNAGSCGSVYIDVDTGQLIGLRRRVDPTLDDGKTEVLSEAKCKQIALDFIVENVIAYEPYVDLEDYRLSETGLIVRGEGEEYEQWNYYYTFRRYVDGHFTSDYIDVGVSQYGSIAEYSRGENCSDLEEWKVLNNVDYQKAKDAVDEFLSRFYDSTYKKTGKLLEPSYIKLYNGLYGLSYVYVESDWTSMLFVPLAKASSVNAVPKNNNSRPPLPGEDD